MTLSRDSWWGRLMNIMFSSLSVMMRRIVAFLLAPLASAVTATILVFLVDFARGEGHTGDLVGDRGWGSFFRYIGMSCQWSYMLAVFPGGIVWLILRFFKIASPYVLMTSAGFVAQSFTLLASADGGWSLFSYVGLGIALACFVCGAAGGLAYWWLAGEQTARRGFGAA